MLQCGSLAVRTARRAIRVYFSIISPSLFHLKRDVFTTTVVSLPLAVTPS